MLRNRRVVFALTVCSLGMLALSAFSQVVAQSPGVALPNILWITSEDTGTQIGCYGDKFADTPHIDSLAAKGMMFTNCWSNAPVCAPARTTIITGCYPNSLGAQHMRSEVRMPDSIRLYPAMLRDLGFYCTNNSKEDYNVSQIGETWDDSSNKAHWRKRKAGQPFFAVFNFTTSHESQIRTRPHIAIHDPAKVPIPPFHPDTPECRQDWAQYYDKVTAMDTQVGRVLAQLREDGLDNDTIVFYYGDHGTGMPRGKRWLYQTGLHVPLVVYVPERFRALAGEQYTPQGKNSRLVSFVDLVPTLLSLAGARPPAYLQGHAFLGKFTAEIPQYIYGFRDRMDERYDMTRAVRDARYQYIRNFMPHRPQGTYLNYMFQTPTTQAWHRLFEEGKLNDAQASFFKPKPAEELYDIEKDPFQINNLAGSSEHRETLDRLRGALKNWMIDICDLGLLPEGEVLERSANSAPYTMGHALNRMAIEKLFDTADLASKYQAGDLDELLKQRVAADSGVRYWVATGLLVRAQQNSDRDAAVKAARTMIGDPSPYVRAIANETMARFDGEHDRRTSIRALLDLANSDKSNLFVALLALNSLDWCQPTTAELGTLVKESPSKDKRYPARYQGYIPRMIERISAIAK